MGAVQFTVTHSFDATPEVVWREMVDWPAHAEWIPATRVEIDAGDPAAIGGEFTGYTGYGPLTLVDRMRITEFSWDAASDTGVCEVDKLGPVLDGRAGFTVRPVPMGAQVVWFEDVDVKYLPGFLAPLVSKLSAIGFAQGMKQLAKVIAAKPSPVLV